LDPTTIEAAQGQYDEEFYERFVPIVSSSAKVVVPMVMEAVRPSSVLDVGCGAGAWLRVFLDHGVDDVLGVDFSDAAREAAALGNGRYRSVDLSRSLQLGRRFDLALCLEVAEHLPAAAADDLVESLVGHAETVLFSAAIPFQGGTGHQNEQWPEYWVEKFRRHGLAVCDFIRPRIWSDPKVAWWYAQNLLLFASEKSFATIPFLREEADLTTGKSLSRVHPTLYLEKVRRPTLWQRLRHRLAQSAVQQSARWPQ
jgi:SAM-dependent methyltransferase